MCAALFDPWHKAQMMSQLQDAAQVKERDQSRLVVRNDIAVFASDADAEPSMRQCLQSHPSLLAMLHLHHLTT